MPVIVFGGSYGGMLAAWLRMKYPHVFLGAFASSAPILYFRNSPDATLEAYNDIITKDYADNNPDIPALAKEGWGYILNADPTQYDGISTLFKTCAQISKTDDLKNLYTHLVNGYAYMSMTDYPYDSNFLMHMPPFPVKAASQYFNGIAPLANQNST